MPMSLGDFFSTATHARPVNPKPVTFTAIAKGKVLPGGASNQHGRPIAAQITAAFVFLGGDGAQRARLEARKALRERFPDVAIDESDMTVETVYQQLSIALHEWDAEEKKVGGRLFDTVDVMREIVEPSEALRLNNAYFAYVDEEHPEVIDDATFRGARESGARMARR